MLTTNRDLQDLADLLAEFQFCSLSTISPDGELQSRPMVLQKARPSSPLWFISCQDNSVVRNLKHDPRANLYMRRDNDHAWVSISGEATLSQDRDLIRKLWLPDWSLWFDGGPETAGITLIDIQPTRVHFWEPEHSKLGRLVELALAKFTNETLGFGETRTLEPTTTEMAYAMSGGEETC